jgi:hypothetical protein
VNVENLNLYEPPMIMDQRESASVPSVEKFSPEYLDDLKEYIILDRRMRTSHRGDVQYLRVDRKGESEEKFPHLYVD